MLQGLGLRIQLAQTPFAMARRGLRLKAMPCAAAMLVAALNATPSLALGSTARLQGIQGKVLLDQGQGFAPAAGASQLKPGDKIFIGTKSSAILAFAQCAVELNKPTVFTLTNTAPCDANGKAADLGGTFITPANASAVVAGGASTGLTTAVTLTFTALVIGTTVNNLALPVSKP